MICGTSARDGDYCDDCRRIYEAERQARQDYRDYGSTDYRRNRARAFARAAGRCELCGLPPRPDDPLVCHHLTPLSRGGTHDLENLRVVHKSEHDAQHRRR